MNNLKCIVTGVSGNLGSLMAELLLYYGFEVIGTYYRDDSNNTNYKDLLKHPSFKLKYLNITDQKEVFSIIEKELPDYFFNFAGEAFVSDCWQNPIWTMKVNTFSIIDILEAIRLNNPECKFFNACSSEIFSGSEESPQTEKTIAKPTSIYGVSKNSSREIIEVYRQKYSLFAVSGILYNMESNRRQNRYVTKKITEDVARIKKALENNQPFEPIKLGNLAAKKDWSFSMDGVEAMFLMTTADTPQDYIISSGENHTVKEFVEYAFEAAGIEGTWVGEKLNEYYILPNYLSDFSEFASHKLVEVDPDFFRHDSSVLLGDSSLAKAELKWQPKVNFKKFIEMMVAHDIRELEKTS